MDTGTSFPFLAKKKKTKDDAVVLSALLRNKLSMIIYISTMIATGMGTADAAFYPIPM